MKQSFRMAVAGTVFAVLFFGVTSRAWSQSGTGNRNGDPGIGQQSPTGMQMPTSSPGSRTTQPKSPLDASDTDEVSKMYEQQAQSRNADRQKRLQLDTEKLLALATELKEQVDKTDKNTLSLEVIKKADEIEKLAKSVKDRMKG